MKSSPEQRADAVRGLTEMIAAQREGRTSSYAPGGFLLGAILEELDERAERIKELEAQLGGDVYCAHGHMGCESCENNWSKEGRALNARIAELEAALRQAREDLLNEYATTAALEAINKVLEP